LHKGVEEGWQKFLMMDVETRCKKGGAEEKRRKRRSSS
jgi:hypothetical protein